MMQADLAERAREWAQEAPDAATRVRLRALADAIDKLTADVPEAEVSGVIWRDDALAAIDALESEK